MRQRKKKNLSFRLGSNNIWTLTAACFFFLCFYVFICPVFNPHYKTWEVISHGKNSKQRSQGKIRMKHPSRAKQAAGCHDGLMSCKALCSAFMRLCGLRGPRGRRSGEPVRLMTPPVQSGAGKWDVGVIILSIDVMRGSRRAAVMHLTTTDKSWFHLNNVLFALFSARRSRVFTFFITTRSPTHRNDALKSSGVSGCSCRLFDLFGFSCCWESMSIFLTCRNTMCLFGLGIF